MRAAPCHEETLRTKMFANLYKNKLKVTVMQEGLVVQTFTVDAGNEHSLEFVVTTELPERSPLHPRALNLDDLEPGLRIQRCNIRSESSTTKGIIIGEPFRGKNDYLQLTVATINYAGELVIADWYLADMGVVPYEGDYGPFWNEQNYTLKG